MTTYATAKTIINRAAVEVGLTSVTDVFASADPNFVQLRSLLNTAGEELLIAKQWQSLTKEYSIVVDGADTGDYTLPTDFNRILDNTAWDYTNDQPMVGPVSNSVWQRLLANTVSPQVYIIYRLSNNRFRTFPQPPATGTNMKFEYISGMWVNVGGADTTYTNECTQDSDVPLYQAIVLQKFLKYRWLSAKGFDTTAALGEFNVQLELYGGAEKGATVVDLARLPRGYCLNVPDQNFNV